tara:strand:- start:7 stop:603 length:597 start_codon:yes stop_codon:yes gene_type:complete
MKDIPNYPHGRVQLYQVDSNNVWTPQANTTNTVLYDWGFIAAKAIGEGDSSYRVNAMYIEFENVASPSDTVSVPTIDRSEGLTYYNGLSGNQDFLRVELIGLPSITIEDGFESYFTEGETGNLLTFFAQSSGTTGVLGNATFGSANNSKIFGAALVAAPVWADRTQDVVFSRSYFATSDQTLKQASSQVGITWEVPFT